MMIRSSFVSIIGAQMQLKHSTQNKMTVSVFLFPSDQHLLVIISLDDYSNEIKTTHCENGT